MGMVLGCMVSPAQGQSLDSWQPLRSGMAGGELDLKKV
jgi:hypothetical protein